MSDLETDEQASEYDHEVVIVGGGPAGCSAGVFTGREGLDTVVFDRGKSSLARCAYLENYLGFPDGIDVRTFYDLIQDHAETAGCEVVPDMVESVDRLDGTPGFVVDLHEGEPVTARRVVAATRYHEGYLGGLADDAIFESDEIGNLDTELVDDDGTTPLDGLYVASLGEKMNIQAVIAAGRGATVGRRVVADARLDDGWWEATATRTDWTQRRAELGEEFDERAPWLDWFDDVYADDAPVETDSDRYRRVRGLCTDEGIAAHITRGEIEARTAVGHQAIASHLDVDAVDETALLDALDEETVRDYVEDHEEIPKTNN
ncbi:NAD(P)/FAD-dependent oxidoreductase [Halomarina ordinaria]|uniref:NAD(P)/FAD-dependent oxidoreductase n=1 Tax=Halomarina ordinaria TaxID=3033939 RepID=A0ABD5UBQ3_9EURY|nr:NAD(P)/FAD-dependent oxidoreductase [Halomarina sp. PSRA2]